MNAGRTIDELIARGATPVLKTAGFARTHGNFHRRKGPVVQVVNFQRSADNRGGSGAFFINVGLAFDGLWKAQGHDLDGPMKRAIDRPLEHECHFRSRLEELIPHCPRWWVISDEDVSFYRQSSQTGGDEIVNSSDNLARAVALLSDCIVRLVRELDQIDGPNALLSHAWRDVPANQGVIQTLARLGSDK